MCQNILQLNEDKTEVMVFGYKLSKVNEYIDSGCLKKLNMKS